MLRFQQLPAEIREKRVLIATVLASGMAFLFGQTIVLALPKIQAEFGATVTQLQWIINAYTLAVAAFILAGGALGDKFGRKKMFLTGIVMYCSAGAISGFSQTVAQLAVLQAIQGLGAALMIPGSLAVINASIAEARRGRAFGIWAAWSAGVGAIAPIIGGSIIEGLGWRWVFFLNLPVGILAFVLAWRNVHDSGEPTKKRLDLLGTAFLFLMLLSSSYAFTRVPMSGWGSIPVAASMLVTVLALLAFLWYEVRATDPIVPPDVFHTTLVGGANAVTFCLYAAIYAFYFLLIFYLEQILGFSAVSAGLSLLPMPVLLFFFSGLTGSWSDRVGPRLPVMLGAGSAAIGYAFLAGASGNGDYFLGVFPGVVLIGLGMTFLAPAVTKAALAVPEHLSGTASGVNNAVSRIAALMAIALFGALLLTLFGARFQVIIAGSAVFTSNEKMLLLAQMPKGAGMTIPASFTVAQKTAAHTFVEDAFLYGLRRIFGLLALLALIGGITAAFTMKTPPKKPASSTKGEP